MKKVLLSISSFRFPISTFLLRICLTRQRSQTENALKAILLGRIPFMRSRRSFRLALGASFFLLSMLHAPIAGAAAPLQKIVFVFAGFNERSGYIFVAKDQRFFEEQGLDAQIVQVRNAQVAVSAIAANEAQFYSTSATGASLGAMAGGLDLLHCRHREQLDG